MMFRIFLLILGCLILLSMIAYAVSLFVKLKHQKKQHKLAQQQRYHQITESIIIIAKAMLAEQCDLSEGVLRLKPLLDIIGKKLMTFSAMWALYQVVEEMPILGERKKLKRNERMKLDLLRESKVAELASQIQQELKQLLQEVEQFKQELK